MRSAWVRIDPERNDWHPHVKGRKHAKTHTERRKPHEDRGREWRGAATSKECHVLLGAGGGWEGFSPEPRQGDEPCRHLKSDFSRAVREDISIISNCPVCGHLVGHL